MSRVVDEAAGHAGSEWNERWERRLLHARWPLVTLSWAPLAETVVVRSRSR